MRTHAARAWSMRCVAICVLAWLLLGSAINYVQAVVIASPVVQARLSGRGTFTARADDGFTVRSNQFSTSATYQEPFIMRIIVAESRQTIPDAERPLWLWIAPRPINSSAGAISQVATGWPYRCVSRSFETVYRMCPDPGWLTKPRPSALSEWLKSVPLIPLWPGFLLNAIVWGFPVLLIPLVKSHRRARRRRRGLCARCGYDLRSGSLAICPECGPPAPSPVDRTQ